MDTFSKQTDDVLVKLFLAGQNEAFDELLLRYKDKVYSYISFRVKNADMADDLFQETFVKAIMHLRQGRYNEQGHFYAWLMCIAHNLLVDLFRTENREDITYNDANTSDVNDLISLQANSYEAELMDEQLIADVCRIMNSLPNEQRDIVYMRFYQDLSFKEIAEKKGISINTALGRMYYAVRNMRKMAQAQNIWIE